MFMVRVFKPQTLFIFLFVTTVYAEEASIEEQLSAAQEEIEQLQASKNQIEAELMEREKIITENRKRLENIEMKIADMKKQRK